MKNISYLKKHYKFIIICIGLMLLAVIYFYLKATVGVPILDPPSAYKRIKNAEFVYIDRSCSPTDCYCYAVFKNGTMYFFYGYNQFDAMDYMSDNYIRVFREACAKVLPKEDLKKIMQWKYEADFYSGKEPIGDAPMDGRAFVYISDGKIRNVSPSTKNMISSSEYLFNYIFIRTHDDSYSDAAFCWIYDGKKYRFTTFDKWYGKNMIIMENKVYRRVIKIGGNRNYEKI